MNLKFIYGTNTENRRQRAFQVSTDLYYEWNGSGGGEWDGDWFSEVNSVGWNIQVTLVDRVEFKDEIWFNEKYGGELLSLWNGIDHLENIPAGLLLSLYVGGYLFLF